LVNNNISDFKFFKEDLKQVVTLLLGSNNNKGENETRVKIIIMLFIIFIIKIGSEKRSGDKAPSGYFVSFNPSKMLVVEPLYSRYTKQHFINKK